MMLPGSGKESAPMNEEEMNGFDRAVEVISPVLKRFYPEGDGKWRVGTGFDYSTGDYGDSVDTDIMYVPFNLSYHHDQWVAKLSVPWIQIKGPGSVIGAGDGGVVIGGGEDEVNTESGLGDIWASLSYSLQSFPTEWGYLDLIGKVKFPTADEDRGLGTGEMDYTLQVDYFKSLGKFSPMATLAYKIKGDPDDYEIDNVFYLSVGADYRYNKEINFGATLDFQEASSSQSDDALELFAYLGYRFSDSFLVTGYGYTGFTNGSPDIGGGAQLRFTF